MLVNLSNDYNLRGYSLEYAARILLRRSRKNNFIFMTCRFDNIDEILIKYRLKVTNKTEKIIDYLRREWKRCDLIEFILDDKTTRNILELIFYEVKTKWHRVERDYFEICKSNDSFMRKISSNYGGKTYIISIILFEDWRFSFNIFNYQQLKIRVYSNHKYCS